MEENIIFNNNQQTVIEHATQDNNVWIFGEGQGKNFVGEFLERNRNDVHYEQLDDESDSDDSDDDSDDEGELRRRVVHIIHNNPNYTQYIFVTDESPSLELRNLLETNYNFVFVNFD